MSPLNGTSHQLAAALAPPTAGLAGTAPDPEALRQHAEVRDAFREFVGQTLFGQMFRAMRATQEPSKYFHGGRTEEVFQNQLDQLLTEEMTEASADQLADPMFELFQLQRSY